MTIQTIAALIGAVPMALDPLHGAGLLALPVPTEARLAGPSALGVPQGERFMVTRGVAVVPVRGILTPNSAVLERYLGWATYRGLTETAQDLAASDDVAAVALDIDSPGGTVNGLEGAVEAIAALAKAKPVYALASPLAASAAYWIGSQARSVSVAPGAVVGSIGIRADLRWPVQPDMCGDQAVVLTSAHARNKAPNPTEPRGQAAIQSELDALEARFLSAVARGRNIPAAELPKRLSASDDPAEGGICYWPEDAVARGLADRIESVRDFYARILEAHAPRMRTPRGRAASAQAEAALAAARS